MPSAVMLVPSASVLEMDTTPAGTLPNLNRRTASGKILRLTARGGFRLRGKIVLPDGRRCGDVLVRDGERIATHKLRTVMVAISVLR